MKKDVDIFLILCYKLTFWTSKKAFFYPISHHSIERYVCSTPWPRKGKKDLRTKVKVRMRSLSFYKAWPMEHVYQKMNIVPGTGKNMQAKFKFAERHTDGQMDRCKTVCPQSFDLEHKECILLVFSMKNLNITLKVQNKTGAIGNKQKAGNHSRVTFL